MQSNSEFLKLIRTTDALLKGEILDEIKYDLEENIRFIKNKIRDLQSEIKRTSFFNFKEKNKLRKDLQELQIALMKYESDYDSKYGDDDIREAYKEIEKVLNEHS